MEKYESNYDYDPQTYCRICDGNLRGIRHLTSKKCKNIELAKAKPPPSRVEQDYEKIETKEDNSEKETREEKNHETLAEKVSKLENEGDDMSDIVKEVEKAEKLMALIRDLENQDLSNRDCLTLKFAQEKD